MRNDINLLQDARIEPEHSEIEIERHDQTEFNDLNNLNNHFIWGVSDTSGKDFVLKMARLLTSFAKRCQPCYYRSPQSLESKGPCLLPEEAPRDMESRQN